MLSPRSPCPNNLSLTPRSPLLCPPRTTHTVPTSSSPPPRRPQPRLTAQPPLFTAQLAKNRAKKPHAPHDRSPCAYCSGNTLIFSGNVVIRALALHVDVGALSMLVGIHPLPFIPVSLVVMQAIPVQVVLLEGALVPCAGRFREVVPIKGAWTLSANWTNSPANTDNCSV